MLRIRLLEPPEASLDRWPLRFEIRKELALLCYLAAEGGRHPRSGLPKELWQIQSRIGEPHERRGENGEAREAFVGHRARYFPPGAC